MNQIIKNIQQESDQLIKQAYFKLRSDSLNRNQIQWLENFLSEQIYKTENEIQTLRSITSKNVNSKDIFEEYYRRRTCLKRIADGLAWIILDYDAKALSALSIGHSPGFMSGKEGYKYERNVINSLFKLPNIRSVIQCDITNVVRSFDVLAVKEDRSIIPIEVKGSKSGGQQKQKKRYKEVLDFISTGEFDLKVKNFMPLHAHKVPIIFSHYWTELEKLAEEALERKFAWSHLEQSLLLLVLDTQNSNQQLIDNVIHSIDWSGGKLIISSLGRHLSRNPKLLPLARLPITIFPINPNLGIEFILGRLDVVIVLDMERIIKLIREKGYICDLNKDGIAKVITKQGIPFSIVHAWDKVLNEIVTIPSFINYVCESTELINLEYQKDNQ